MRPKIGHYVIQSLPDCSCEVLADYVAQKVVLRVNKQTIVLSGGEAVKMARGLIVSAEQVQYPQAVLARDAYVEGLSKDHET